MRVYILILTACLLTCILPAAAQSQKKSIRLPNGWWLSPAGRSLPLGDLPLNIAVSAKGKYMAVTNNGQSTQSIQLIDPVNEKILHKVVIPKSWYGLCFSPNEKSLYASGGNDNIVWQYAIRNNKLILNDSIILGDKWPEKISPSGLAIDAKRNELYVVTKDNNQLYIIDLKTKKISKTIPLGAEAYTCLVSPDQQSLYISLWGSAQIAVVDLATQAITKKIEVGHHPNELLITRDGKFLYTANASDNSVSVIDMPAGKVIEVLNAALYPDAPAGSVSNGLALSANEKTLYVANADNNCLAVFDVQKPGESKSAGFIPTGWYPTNVKVFQKKIFVSNGKGFSSFANPKGPNPAKKRQSVNFQKADNIIKQEVQYIGGLMKGTLSIIPMPTPAKLAEYSKAVYKNTPYTKAGELVAKGEPGNPIPMKVGDSSPIKYVFYILKENRTYDQVLGDVAAGNGDTSLVLFGETITPNQHKLVKEFVLLDNFYVDSEVSADGHNWSLSGHATDYLEKTWPTSYGGRGGDYDGEGRREIANPRDGFIWDYCKRAKVSYRTYGEFADDYKANIPVLEDHFCTYYTSWDQSVRDTTRVNQWKRDFDSMLAIKSVPQFNSLRLINDHTEGQRIGHPTPFAHVADNDLAVGLFIEHLSKSSIWNQSVVFIVEDDAQNGPDHIDAHRSTAYVAGGYVKRNFADHTMYSTTSMLRTIELILGLPPMSQYDAAAVPMWRCFNKTPDSRGFTAVPAQIDLNEKNTVLTAGSEESSHFDFSKEDNIPDLVFSEVIWKAVKGEKSVMPAPRRSAFLMVKEKD
jgi:YVTN family beta-propeller protein